MAAEKEANKSSKQQLKDEEAKNGTLEPEKSNSPEFRQAGDVEKVVRNALLGSHKVQNGKVALDGGSFDFSKDQN